MSRSGRTNEERRKATKQKIMRAALDLFAQRGYHLVAPKDISREAGVSVGILYHYFKNKKDIAAYLIENLGQVLVEQVEQGFFNAPTYEESIQKGFAALFDFVEQNKAGFSALLREFSNEELKEHLDTIIEKLIGDSRRRIAAQQKLGILRRDVDDEITARLVQDLGFSAVRLYLEKDVPREAVLDVLIKLQAHGLTARER